MIPKADGKQRPLGIPTVRDRVVQTAVVLLLLPIYEADFHENSYAYRPRRRAQQAADAVKVALLEGGREVVDADLSGYFDTIPHARLMRLVKGWVSDGAILRLIKGWLRAPIVEEDRQTGVKRTVANRCGTPQGARSTQWREAAEVFARVNQRARGWIGYFHYANSSRVFDKMQWQVRERMRRWLWKKHAKTKAQYGRQYCDERLHEHCGLIRFRLKAKWRHS